LELRGLSVVFRHADRTPKQKVNQNKKGAKNQNKIKINEN